MYVYQAFVFTPTGEAVVRKLLRYLVTALILVYPDWNVAVRSRRQNFGPFRLVP